MFLPPDLREWVAENDLVRLILEAVEQTDLRVAVTNVRGSGSLQYPPGMMLALLIYCYARGWFSSRQIEQASYENVAARYLCANTHPDHDTIAKFRRENRALFESCFCTVLSLARELGLVRLGAVAIDGTRLAANASGQKFRTRDQLEQERQAVERLVQELLARAEAADQLEEDGAGTQLPGVSRCRDQAPKDQGSHGADQRTGAGAKGKRAQTVSLPRFGGHGNSK